MYNYVMRKYLHYTALFVMAATAITLHIFAITHLTKTYSELGTIKTLALLAIIATLFFVIVTEFRVRMRGFSKPTPILFIHIGAGVIFLISLILIYRDASELTATLLFVNAFTFLGTFISGLKLLRNF
ncbi:MAG TPA: hypothetical protein PKD79_02925 [Candidatus Doudnabacteria bacterium]|nr:hypothetical protein [Candidatus Doudnabacteria bacterium]